MLLNKEYQRVLSGKKNEYYEKNLPKEELNFEEYRLQYALSLTPSDESASVERGSVSYGQLLAGVGHGSELPSLHSGSVHESAGFSEFQNDRHHNEDDDDDESSDYASSSGDEASGDTENNRPPKVKPSNVHPIEGYKKQHGDVGDVRNQRAHEDAAARDELLAQERQAQAKVKAAAQSRCGSKGLAGEGACCAAVCGTCSESRGCKGGEAHRSRCCPSAIISNGRSCDTHLPPCALDIHEENPNKNNNNNNNNINNNNSNNNNNNNDNQAPSRHVVGPVGPIIPPRRGVPLKDACVWTAAAERSTYIVNSGDAGDALLALEEAGGTAEAVCVWPQSGKTSQMLLPQGDDIEPGVPVEVDIAVHIIRQDTELVIGIGNGQVTAFEKMLALVRFAGDGSNAVSVAKSKTNDAGTAGEAFEYKVGSTYVVRFSITTAAADDENGEWTLDVSIAGVSSKHRLNVFHSLASGYAPLSQQRVPLINFAYQQSIDDQPACSGRLTLNTFEAKGDAKLCTGGPRTLHAVTARPTHEPKNITHPNMCPKGGNISFVIPS